MPAGGAVRIRLMIAAVSAACLVPDVASALELKFVEEFRGNRDFVKLNETRHVLVGSERESDPADAARPTRLTFDILDVVDREVAQVVIPIGQLYERDPDKLGKAQPEIVYYNGTITGFLFKRIDLLSIAERRERGEMSRTIGERTEFFVFYDNASGKFSPLIELGRHDGFTHMHPEGIDPQDRYFYYQYLTYDYDHNVNDNKRTSFFGGPISFKLYRIDLAARAPEFVMDVYVVRRDEQLSLRGPFFSSDGSKFAMVEYYERSFVRDRGEASPQQQIYVIDVEKRLVTAHRTPLTSYGVAFTGDGRHLVVGSHETGELQKIDLETGKTILQEKGTASVIKFLPTPSGRSFLSLPLGWRSSDARHRWVEVRRFSDLAATKQIPTRSVFKGAAGIHPSPIEVIDGAKYLLAPVYGKDGFPDSSEKRGVQLFEIVE